MKKNNCMRPNILPLLAIVLSLFLATPTLAEEDPRMFPFPPLDPINETVVRKSDAFVQECKSFFDKAGYTDRYTLGTSLITKSDEWGLVYRVDFLVPGLNTANKVNRLICQKNASGEMTVIVAIGHDGIPLSD